MHAPDVRDGFRELHQALDWTLGEMARELGVPIGTYGAWEYGRARPDPLALAVLSERYGWPGTMFEADGERPATTIRLATRQQNARLSWNQV